ncbi:hypothetical protein [Actinospongicola halichondriae]|uniref:hypothetical protein n=1 Tax=Actinospongicola halichondriae TaxID=3236844 RepID=UPI003D38350C
MTGLAVALTAGAATLPGAGASPSTDGQAPSAQPPIVRRGGPALDPITRHAIDPAALEAARSGIGGATSVMEEVRLEIVGGELTVGPADREVTLHRVPGTRAEWVGDLGPVEVVDARGTHDGWTLRWFVDGIDVAGSERHRIPAAKVRVVPGDLVVVAGDRQGLTIGRAHPATKKGAVLLSADRGWGAGTQQIGGTVSLRLPASIDAETVSVRLSFAVA